MDVIGYPIMCTPTDTDYTCIPCNCDYYNLNPNNVKFFKSCEPNKNKYNNCKDQNTTILQDH